MIALERRIEADLIRGTQANVVVELEALVAQHPYRERFRAQLMLALYRSGAAKAGVIAQLGAKGFQAAFARGRKDAHEVVQEALRRSPTLTEPT